MLGFRFSKTLSIVAAALLARSASAQAPPLSSVTLPAGTRVVMALKVPVHTTSGTAGSGLYLETLFPVIQDNRVVIPPHTFVQGTIEAAARPGHVKRVSEFRFSFKTMIFPNNSATPIDGALLGIPGAKDIRVRDENGTLQPVDQTEKVVAPLAKGAVGGAIVGSVQQFGIGKVTGAGLGVGLALGYVLLKRGDDINLAKGTNVEMILRAPLTLSPEQVASNAGYIAPVVPETNKSVAPRDDEVRPKQSVLEQMGPGWQVLIPRLLHR